MLPIADDTGGRREAVACLTLMALCVAVWAWQLATGVLANPLVRALAFTPGWLFGGAVPPAGIPVIPPPATLVTYVFLHGGWVHLLGNLLYLWVFGPKVEQRLGAGRFTLFFVAGGVAAALGQALGNPSSAVAMVGASGAISAILGAYVVLFPRAEVRLLVPVLIVLRIVTLPAWAVLAAWFLIQLLFERLVPAGAPGIAFAAHVAGFIAGILLVPFLATGWTRALLARR